MNDDDDDVMLRELFLFLNQSPYSNNLIVLPYASCTRALKCGIYPPLQFISLSPFGLLNRYTVRFGKNSIDGRK